MDRSEVLIIEKKAVLMITVW